MNNKKPVVKRRLTPEERKDEITRKVALVVAFVAVFYFFIKLIFL